MNTLTRFTTVAVLLVLANSLVAAHPYHVSMAEIEWNPKSSSFEVAVCVWPADLEKELSRLADRPVNLDTEKQLEQMTSSFASRNVLCLSNKKPAEFRWVGMERTDKKAWLYFELKPAANATGGFEFRNEMFFETNAEQQNYFIVRRDDTLSRGFTNASRPTFVLPETD